MIFYMYHCLHRDSCWNFKTPERIQTNITTGKVWESLFTGEFFMKFANFSHIHERLIG